MRLPSTLAIAVCGTAFLFWLIYALIHTRDAATPTGAENIAIDFIRTIRTEETHSKQRALVRPQRLEAQVPPPPPLSPLKPPPLEAPIENPTLETFDFAGLLASAPIDGDALALVRVLPHYPPRALQRGIEGWVLLEFSIDALGTPLSPRIIESEPKGIFDSAAIAAVKRWRYRPSDNQQSPLIRQRIRFQLAQ